MTDEKTSRVAMLWPESLKEQVREKAGGRGLTRFTIDAVQAKLGNHDAHQADTKELNEVKDLAQRLADAIATGGDYENREEVLRYIGLPSWIETVGWPDRIAAVVSAEDSTPEPVDPQSESEPELVDHPFEPSHTGMVCERIVMRNGGGDQCGLPPEAHTSGAYDADGYVNPDPEVAPVRRLRRVEDVELPAVGDPGTIRSDLPGQDSSDLLDRVRAKAMEKGVDLSGIDLKPASTVERRDEEVADPIRERVEAGATYAEAIEYGHDREGYQCAPEICGGSRLDPCTYSPEEIARFEQAERDAEAAANPNVCPKCGSELVGDECWECM